MPGHGGAPNVEGMQSILLAMTLAAGMQLPAAATTSTPDCDVYYTADGRSGYSACVSGTGYQHRIVGICYAQNPGSVSEYAATPGPWANPDARSWTTCK